MKPWAMRYSGSMKSMIGEQPACCMSFRKADCSWPTLLSLHIRKKLGLS